MNLFYMTRPLLMMVCVLILISSSFAHVLNPAACEPVKRDQICQFLVQEEKKN